MHQPLWYEPLYFSTSVKGVGSLVLSISGHLVFVLEGQEMAQLPTGFDIHHNFSIKR